MVPLIWTIPTGNLYKGHGRRKLTSLPELSLDSKSIPSQWAELEGVHMVIHFVWKEKGPDV